jgi:hypothetical protein
MPPMRHRYDRLLHRHLRAPAPIAANHSLFQAIVKGKYLGDAIKATVLCKGAQA